MIFAGCYESLAKIADFVRQAAAGAGMNEEDLYAVETAVDEACSNIIEHGYHGEGIGDIECTCSVTAGEVTVILKDQAKPFTPGAISFNAHNLDLYEHPGHGLGMYFMHKMMDEIHYTYIPGQGNQITMIKRYKVQP